LRNCNAGNDFALSRVEALVPGRLHLAVRKAEVS
jgi:hypothetical protein